MTKVQQSFIALFAAIVVAVGGALMLGTPQQAYADVLTAGSTFDAAKAMPLTGKSLASTDDTWFGSNQIRKYYKFTTSGRDSSYKVTVKNNSDDDIDVQLYDSRHADVGRSTGYNFTVSSKKSRVLESLDRNATYYLELSRPTQGDLRADYTITIKEIVTPPATPGKVRALSKAKNSIRIKYSSVRIADGYQVAVRKGTSGKWTTKTTKKTQYVFWKLKKAKNYQVRVRAYRTINKKNYYGEWSDPVTLKPNGKKKTYYAGN